MFGTIARLLLVRVIGRRLIPILTVVEVVQLLRRRRESGRQSPARPAAKTVGPSRSSRARSG
jgi:hypothetical protein